VTQSSDRSARRGPESDPFAVLLSVLDDLELPYECSSTPAARTVVVELPGTHKLKIPVAISIGAHSVAINAFVVRAPAEHEAQVHRWLLRRNQRLFGVGYALDHLGDVYLVARLPLSVLSAQSVDELLGSIAATADGDFDTLLEMGFESAIRAEWRWRLDRGESTRNLMAFQHLAPDSGP
jgi:hypothetical protein